MKRINNKVGLNCSIIAVAVVLTFLIGGTSCVSLEKDITLTQEERNILGKFRESVESVLPHEYMKKDIYLIRWLRARNFDIGLARQMLFDNLEWREKNRIDDIHNEDWSDFIERYKFWHEGVDKEGRPIALLNIGTWDMRGGVIRGETERMHRYIYRGFDLLVNKVRKWQDEGRNVSQIKYIANLSGYTLAQQGCPQCLQFYISVVSTYELRYPGCADAIYLVNVPSIFEIVLAAVRPIFSPNTREILKIFGTNRRDYGAQLFKDIDKNQLPADLGGTDDGSLYPDFDEAFY